MKVTIPEELKKNAPDSKWGKILTVTPVVMTVVATLLAGLASSEMTTAQYDRALGAQLQSKAGDQWGYFQAKKLRGAMLKNSLEVRYDVEAKLNQAIANMYELQVRKANISAERHHKRSGQFFFGMLAAQAAVIIATLAMAAQRRSLLWSVAAAAGLAAILFAVYVYLRV